MSKVFSAHAVSVDGELPKHVHLRLLEAIPAPGVTHLRYEVVR
jgi:hypothetical protein